MAKEKKIFAGGGMDMDTEERLIKSNDYRYALNCRIASSDEENEGTVENIRGNQILNSGLTTSDGTLLEEMAFTIIGHYEDKKLDIFYYFVHHTGGKHCIVSNFAWDANLGGRPTAFKILYESPTLNFHTDYLITGVNMIHSDEFAKGGMLYWTDDRNPPRKLNPLRAYWWTHPSTLSDPALTYVETPNLNAIVAPPIDSPMIGEFSYTDINGNIQFTTGNNTSLRSNDIKSNLWQFKYRYIYRDNIKSAWSPISPSGMTSFNDGTIPDLSISNYLEVKIDSGVQDVKSIELAVRENEDKGDFYLISTIDKDNTKQENVLLSSTGGTLAVQNVGDVIVENIANKSNLYYIFTNNEPRIPIDLQESNRLFDDVPLLAKSQEIVDGNRLVYGNVVNGYDPVPTDTDFEIVYTPNTATRGNIVPVDYSISISHHHWVGSGANPWARRYFKAKLDINVGDISTVPLGTLVKISLQDIGVAAHFFRPSSTFCGSNQASRMSMFSIDYVTTITATNNTITDLVNEMNNGATLQWSSIDSDGDSSITPSYGLGHNFSSGKPDNDFNNYSSVGSFSDTPFFVNGNKIQFRFGCSHNERFRDSCLSVEPILVIGFDGEALYSTDINLNTNATSSTWIGSVWHGGPIKYTGWDNPENSGWFTGSSLPALQYDIVWRSENNSAILGPVATSVSNLRGFKSGVKHSLGIVYYDEYNRSGTVNPCGDIYVPFRNERGDNLDPSFNALTNNPLEDASANIHFNINHAAPTWATHWQWVWAPHKRGDFLHITVNTLEYDNTIKARYRTVLPESQDQDATSGTFSGFQSLIESSITSHGYVKMDMEELIRHSSKSSLDDFMWDWAPGDRMRILDLQTSALGGGLTTPNYAGMDFEIIGIEEDPTAGNAKLWYILEKSAVNAINSGGTAIDVRIELYRPVKIKNDVYYEFGHVNTCSNGNHMVNKYSTEDQLSGSNAYLASTGLATPNTFHYNQNDPAHPTSPNANPAEGTLEDGDVYLRERIMITAGSSFGGPLPTGGIIIVEDYSYSDFYKSQVWDLGRPNAYLPDFKQTRREATIFFSEPFVPNTAINGLGTFYPDVSFKEYDKKFNSIQKLHSINDSIIIFQEDKISKAMVSRAVLFDATGKQNLAISSNVLSSSVPYAGDFGISLNPESFANFGFRSYFVDARRRAVLRLSQDGLTVISEHKMKNFFTDYFQEVIDRRKTRLLKIYGAYDNKFDEYVVSVANTAWQITNQNGGIDRYSIPGFTIGFNEPLKRWNSFYSFINYIAVYNETLHSFKGASIYKHNSLEDSNGDPVYNIFYDMEQDSVLEFPFNNHPDTTKVYHNISEHSNNIWSIDALHTKNNQMTDISFEEFTNNAAFSWEEGHGTKENIHNAVIRCNILTPGVANPKIEGDRMRDTSIMCRLLLDSPRAQGQTVLFSVTVNFIPSSGPDLIG